MIEQKTFGKMKFGTVFVNDDIRYVKVHEIYALKESDWTVCCMFFPGEEFITIGRVAMDDDRWVAYKDKVKRPRVSNVG